MAKYRLLAKHYIQDTLLDEGVIVGDETAFKIAPEMVTPDMEGLDDEAKANVEKAHERTTHAMAAAPQLGLLYLEPDVKAALLAGAKPAAAPGVATRAPNPMTEPPGAAKPNAKPAG